MGIVKSVRQAPGSRSSYFISFLGTIGSHLILCLVACHIFDWLTSQLPARTKAFVCGARNNDEPKLQRLAWRRSLLGMTLGLALVLVAVTSWREVSGIAIAPLQSTVQSILVAPIAPLVWLLQEQLPGWKRASIMTALLAVPLVGLVIVVLLWLAAGRALRADSK